MIFRAFLFSLFFLPLSAGATTISDLESKIAALLSQIQILQSELQTLKSGETTPTPQASVVSSFTQTLGKGSEGSEVTKLQQYLAGDPALYPEGLVTGYYGSLTEAAVKRFQQKHNIVSSGTPATTGYGAFGPKTRATLNALLVEPTAETVPTGTPTVPYTPNTPNRS
ncbi:MAG: peptidoglycan-binding protein, partial [Patescibacteria group bacterium]|nr:peptidoglycan-binding protein [Patescibacteria group bacterium]